MHAEGRVTATGLKVKDTMADDIEKSTRGRSLTGQLRAAFDWTFRDRTGNRITIAQFPNLPLLLFLASVVVGWLVAAHSTFHSVVEWIGSAALAWWAIDEILRGANPWRRLLGILGCAYVGFRVFELIG